MNARINEISKEAWRQIDVSKIRGRHQAYTKIFAELIVKDCLLYTAPSNNNTATNTETDRALAWAHQNIKEHFGVE
jgi:hypothetical protein